MMVLESSAAGGDGDGEGDVEGDDGALAAAFGVNTLQSSQHCFEAHQGPVHRTQSNRVVFSVGLEKSGSVMDW